MFFTHDYKFYSNNETHGVALVSLYYALHVSSSVGKNPSLCFTTGKFEIILRRERTYCSI